MPARDHGKILFSGLSRSKSLVLHAYIHVTPGYAFTRDECQRTMAHVCVRICGNLHIDTHAHTVFLHLFTCTWLGSSHTPREREASVLCIITINTPYCRCGYFAQHYDNHTSRTAHQTQPSSSMPNFRVFEFFFIKKYSYIEIVKKKKMQEGVPLVDKSNELSLYRANSI